MDWMSAYPDSCATQKCARFQWLMAMYAIALLSVLQNTAEKREMFCIVQYYD